MVWLVAEYWVEVSSMNRDEYERQLFEKAMDLRGLGDERHPFDAERFLEGFTEEARILSATDDPVLAQLAATADAAWAAFLAQEDDETP